MTIPEMQPSVLSAKESSGVGLSDSNTYALMPFAAMHSAASSANSGDMKRESYAIAIPFSCPFALIM